jgi:hypothetical protein
MEVYGTGDGTEGSRIYTVLCTAVAVYGMVGSPSSNPSLMPKVPQRNQYAPLRASFNLLFFIFLNFRSIASDEVLLPKINEYFHMNYSDIDMIPLLQDDFNLESISYVAVNFTFKFKCHLLKFLLARKQFNENAKY